MRKCDQFGCESVNLTHLETVTPKNLKVENWGENSSLKLSRNESKSVCDKVCVCVLMCINGVKRDRERKLNRARVSVGVSQIKVKLENVKERES